MTKTNETNATINLALATLEESNDALAQLLSYLLKQSEIALAIDVLKMEDNDRKRTIANVRTLSNNALCNYLTDHFDMVHANNFFAVACLVEFSARCVMGKLKGKYSMHCDNLHVRNRRFNFIHTYKKYCDNGFLLERPYTASDVSTMVNREFDDIRTTLFDYCENKKTVDNMFSQFMVKQRLNLIVEDIRTACLNDEKKDKNGFMYSDIELLNTFIESVLSWVHITKETDLNALTVVVCEKYDGLVERQNDRPTYYTKETNGRKSALCAIDKEIAQNRRIAIEEIKDVHRTASGSEKKGIYETLTREEMEHFETVAGYIMKSERIARDLKADAIATLYMRLLGYGYDAIATYLCITKRTVQTILTNIALTLATTEKYQKHIAVVKDASRHSVPLYIH